MKILIVDKFLKTIPDDKKKLVYDKLSYISRMLIKEKKTFRELPHGFWGRKIKNSNGVFKFRLNSGDRILFTYYEDADANREGFLNSLIFIAYSNHDRQIKKARKYKGYKITEFEIDKTPFDSKEDIDYKIESDFYDYKIDLNQSVNAVVDENILKDLSNQNDDDILYYLNEEQFSCLNHESMMLLSGSAGSGKTTVGIHRAISSPQENRMAYFTYTNALKENTLKLFEKHYPYNRNHNKRFYTVNEFFMMKSNKNDRCFINFERFEKWLIHKKDFFDVKKVSNVDLWAEIRGIIKGFMGIDWIRNKQFKKKHLENKTIKVLKMADYVYESDKQHLHWIKNYNKTDKNPQRELYKSLIEMGISKKDVDYIYKQIANKNYNGVLIDYESYLNLPNEYTIFNKKIREKIYNLSESYQKWLDDNGYFDENDIAYEEIYNLDNKNADKFDFIILDEVQDLTELQIYALINSVKNKANLFISGDSHQIINPTYFNFGRLQNYCYVNGVKYVKKSLSRNYRSQENIVELANRLTKLRKKYIGSSSEDFHETFMRKGNKVFFLKKSKNNFQELINVINSRHYAAIVVADNSDKQKIVNNLNIDNGRVYTVSEAKGLEFSYVLCFNITSKYIKECEKIFNYKGKKNSKYRYFFNLFYVGITRARNNLMIYEEKADEFIMEKTGLDFKVIDEFSVEETSLKEFSSPYEWMKEAERLEKEEAYENAEKAYRQASDIEGARTGEVRCKAKMEARKGNFEKAVSIMMSINKLNLLAKEDKSLILELAKKSENNYLILKAKVTCLPEKIKSYSKNESLEMLSLLDFNKMKKEEVAFINNEYYAPRRKNYKDTIDEIIITFNCIKEG